MIARVRRPENHDEIVNAVAVHVGDGDGDHAWTLSAHELEQLHHDFVFAIAVETGNVEIEGVHGVAGTGSS